MLLFALLACQRPPPAPEGLDDSARHLLREFWSDDETLAAGLTGLVAWFDEEGFALVGVDATQDNVDGFTVADLEADDVAAMELDDDGRDLAAANGIIGVATIACTPADADTLLTRADQAVVFDDYDAYVRTYTSDRAAYAAGVEPVLRTDNELTVSALGTSLTYRLLRDFRHATYRVGDADTDVALAWSYVPEAAGDGTVLRQNYGVEVVIARGDEPSLRAFAVWTEVDSPVIGPDSPIWPATAVNTTRQSAERMDALCTGAEEIPPEP